MLAVTLAGSYVRESHWLQSELGKYLEEYQTHRDRLLGQKARRRTDRYSESVMSTWEISFAAVKRRSPVAAQLPLATSTVARDWPTNTSTATSPALLRYLIILHIVHGLVSGRSIEVNTSSSSSTGVLNFRSTMASDETDSFYAAPNDVFYSSNTYQRLSADKKEIRLLRILPGQDDSQIECQLIQEVALAQPDHIAYHALSYSAGNLKDIVQVKIESIDFNVFRSVWEVMQQMRSFNNEHGAGDHAKEWPPIWIDQICINQSDLTEKASQVLFMQTIYASASNVLLWLGKVEVGDQAERAFGFISALAQLAQTHHFLGMRGNSAPEGRENTTQHELLVDASATHDDGYVDERSYRDSADVFITKLKSHDEDVLQGLEAIRKLWAKSWWKRCWVMQEAIVAEDIAIIWGNHLLKWTELVVGDKLLRFVKQQLVSLMVDKDSEETRVSARSLFASIPESTCTLVLEFKQNWAEKQTNLRFTDVLQVSRQQGCTDARDRVYAFLGLVGPTKYGIIPSYERKNSVANVFVEVASAIIKHGPDLDIIAYANEVGRDDTLHLPSWVPDLQTETGRFSLCGWEEGRPEYDASRDYHDTKKPSSKVPGPTFLPDAAGNSVRVLKCTAIDVGPLYGPEGFDQLPTFTAAPPGVNRVDHFKDRLKALGLNMTDLYAFRDRPEQTVDHALTETLSCRSSLISIAEADPVVARVDEIFRGHLWRFFLTPEKIMGIAPSGARPRR